MIDAGKKFLNAASKGQERLWKYKIKAINYFWTCVFHYINILEALYSLSVKASKDRTFIKWRFKVWRYCNCKVWVWAMLLLFFKGYHIHTGTSVIPRIQNSKPGNYSIFPTKKGLQCTFWLGQVIFSMKQSIKNYMWVNLS